MQTLEHWAKHKQFLFVALGHFGSCHACVCCVGQHQKQVSIERTTNAVAAVLDVVEQVLQIEVDFECRANAATWRVRINKRYATRQCLDIAVLHRSRHLERWLDLVIDCLGFAQLLVLQLLDVTKRFHARAVAVDVTTSSGPAWRQGRKQFKARLSQELAVVAAHLKMVRRKGHVHVVALAIVSVCTRLDGMNDGHPCVK